MPMLYAITMTRLLFGVYDVSVYINERPVANWDPFIAISTKNAFKPVHYLKSARHVMFTPGRREYYPSSAG